MNPSVLYYSVGFAAAQLQPSTGFIWENIQLGKQILEFIGEFPEWGNYERDLKEKLDSLKGKRKTLTTMEMDLQDEVRTVEFQNNGRRKRQVSNWLRNVRAKVDGVNSREEEMQRRNFISRFLFRAWLGKCVKMEEEEVEELIKQREALGFGLALVLVASNDTIQHQLVASTLVGNASFKKRLEIWTVLLSQKVRIVGIVGEQGVGKTTIMASIHNQEVAYSGLFKRAFYVNVKEYFNLYQLQAAIGEAMDLHDLKNIRDESFRASRIQRGLKLSGKFLLILDGLSKYFQLTKVGIPIEENGGKLVVVSRSQTVCRQVCDDRKNVIRVEKMTEEDSLELFWNTVTSSAELSPDIEELAGEIVRKCGGVPSKIVDTAVSLRNVDEIFEWRVKLRELERLDDAPLTTLNVDDEDEALMVRSYRPLTRSRAKVIAQSTGSTSRTIREE